MTEVKQPAKTADLKTTWERPELHRLDAADAELAGGAKPDGTTAS